MPSASPMYTFSSVFREPETPLTHSGGSEESNNSNMSECSNHNDNIGNTVYNLSTKTTNLIKSTISSSISNGSNSGSNGYTYDPFKCLSAMAEQSFTGNFTHSSSVCSIVEGSIYNTKVNSSSASNYNSVNNNSSVNLDQSGQYQHCDRNMYMSVSSSSPLSSMSPPSSPSSLAQYYVSTSKSGISNDFLGNAISSYERISTPDTTDSQSHDFLRSNSQFSENPTASQHSGRAVISNTRFFCKKNYPSCSSERSLDDSDRLLSWTLQHPQGWTKGEVLDWVFFVAQEQGLDMQEFRGENFQAYTGAQLCQMELEDFLKLEPKFGKILYGLFRKLLCGVVFQKPLDADQLSSSCIQMSPYSSLLSPETSTELHSYPQSSYHAAVIETNNCNGLTQNTYFKQEQCSNNDNSSIEITTFDFDLDDTPCLTSSQCPEQYQQEYSLYSAQFPQNTTISTACCFPAPPFSGQLPRRRPGRPRVKSFMDDERVSKEKKVKNQHLWEFIYETLMNPMYNPQYLRWENQRDGVFRFVQSEAVAQLWGGRKNNENMTYEKLSRAMRHYYRRGILERVEGRRLVYKFSLKAMERIRDKRNSV